MEPDKEIDEDAALQKPIGPGEMSRSDRRNKLRFLKKELTKHERNKPSLDVMSDDPEVQEKNVHRVRAWSTRYGILVRKIDELDEFKRRSKRDSQ